MPLLSDIIIPKPKRSNSNRSFVSFCSHSPSLIYPIFQQFYPAGSDVRIAIDNMVRTNPTHAPLFGRFRQDYHIFFCPLSLYSEKLRNDETMLANSSEGNELLGDIKFPQLHITGDPSQGGSGIIAKGNVLDYLEYGSSYSGVGEQNIVDAEYFPMANYQAVVSEYFANRQLGYIPYQDVSSIQWRSLYSPGTSSGWYGGGFFAMMDSVYKGTDRGNLSFTFAGAKKCGLYLRHLQNDMLNTFLNSEELTRSSSLTRMSTSAGYLTFDQFRTSSTFTGFFERLIAGGGRFSDWLKITSGVTTRIGINKPEYIGSVSGYIDFSLVTATAAGGTGSSATVLGDLAGRGGGSIKSRVHRVKISTPGYIFITYSFIPEITYPNYCDPLRKATHLSDYYNPLLDRIGWQSLDSRVFLGTLSNSAGSGLYGKCPAWQEQISAVNKSHGRLADVNDLSYWTLTFSPTKPGSDLADTPCYSTPANAQLIFDSNTVDNFFVMHSFNVRAKQPKSKFTLPKVL